MHVYQKVAKGTSLLSIAEVANQACSLIRNIILARFLTKADFGVAALLGLVLTLFELSSKMALNQQVVQSKYGDKPGFVASVQFAQFTAGAISAFLILIGAWPLAHFFFGPRYVLSIMALALIPLVNGLSNLDICRYARKLHYGPQILADSIPQVITTLAAWPLAAFFKDYRAVLVLLLGKAFLSAMMTHLLAERRYSIQFDAQWLRESFKFGWPLLLGGVIQIGNFQGDSMVVAASYSLAQLGVYSVAMTIAMAPSLTIMRIGSSLGLPLLGEVQNDVPRFIARYGRFVQIMALIGCVVTLSTLFCGEQIVVLLFGTKYVGVGALACWLTAAQSLRILRGATIIATMARGDTVNNMVSSAWRLSGLVLAVILGVLKADLTWFAAAAFIGEVVALGSTVVRLDSKHSVSPIITTMPAALGLVCVLFATAIKWCLSIGPYSFLNLLLLPMFILSSTSAFILCFREPRAAAAGLILHFKDKLGGPFSKKPSMLGGPVFTGSSDPKE